MCRFHFHSHGFHFIKHAFWMTIVYNWVLASEYNACWHDITNAHSRCLAISLVKSYSSKATTRRLKVSSAVYFWMVRFLICSWTTVISQGTPSTSRTEPHGRCRRPAGSSVVPLGKIVICGLSFWERSDLWLHQSHCKVDWAVAAPIII